ncbi:hypothetical protein PFISCL1PPCAC_1048, partial [Pristionchus fissidentatus]
ETVKGSHELLAVDLDINGDLIRFVCIYRNPKATTLQTDALLKSIIDLCSCPQPTVITGDFNLPDIDWPLFKENVTPASQLLVDLCQSIKLAQLVKDPTRKGNILDLVLCNSPGLISNTEVGNPFDISDHQTVQFQLSLSHSVPVFTLRRDYKKADYALINCQLANVDWVLAFSTIKSVDDMYDLLMKLIQKTIDIHVPWIRVSVTHGKVPPHIDRLISKRFVAWQQSISGNDPAFTSEFERLNRQFRKELTRYHKTIERRVIDSEDSNKFFRFMKKCTSKSKGVEGLKKSDGTLVMDDHGKANLLAETFASVFTNDNGQVPVSNPLPNTGNFLEPSFMRHEICALIERWKKSGCRTPENINLAYIKEIAVPISEPLEIIFRQSYETPTVPSLWRHSIVTPVKKSPPFSDPLNYRPISITSLFCRVFERLLCKPIITHCENAIALKGTTACHIILRALRTNNVEILIKAYSIYIRPILESASMVFNPYLKRDKEVLEKVQNYFTRRLFIRCYNSSWQTMPSSTTRNKKLGLLSLEKRRDEIDLKSARNL